MQLNSRKLAGLLGLGLILMLLPGFAQGKALVVVSIHPYYDLTRQIGGDAAEVVRMLPAGASPHTFEPSPSQARLAARADLLIMNGGVGVDDWLRRLVSANDTNAPLLEIMREVDLDLLLAGGHDDHLHEDEPAGDESHEDHDEHEHDGQDAHDVHDKHDDDEHDHHGQDAHDVHDEHDDDEHDDHDEEAGRTAYGDRDIAAANPHVWLDVRIAVQAASAIEEALVRVDPENEATYRANGERLRSELEALDHELMETLAPVRGEAFVPFHNAWPYFARRYGLDLVLEIEPFPGREPSPAYLRDALREIATSGARAVFSERQLSQRPARVVADEAGLPLHVLDPEGGTDEQESYQDLMRYNARTILDALGR